MISWLQALPERNICPTCTQYWNRYRHMALSWRTLKVSFYQRFGSQIIPWWCQGWVKSLQEASAPTNKQELQSFLGMLTYNAKFLSNMSHTCTPYTNFYARTLHGYGGPSNKKALEAAKGIILALAHFDIKKPLKLYCDASPYGLELACYDEWQQSETYSLCVTYAY